MRRTALSVLRTACRHPPRRPICRFVAGVRYGGPRRAFHGSSLCRSVPASDAPAGNDKASEDAVSKQSGEVDPVSTTSAALEPPPEAQQASQPGPLQSLFTTDSPEQDGDSTPAPRSDGIAEELDATRNGGARTRKMITPRKQRQQPQGLPVMILPPWFASKNVKLYEESQSARNLSLAISDARGSARQSEASAPVGEGEGDSRPRSWSRVWECELPESKDAKYSIHADVYLEILAAIRSALTLRPDAVLAEKRHGRPLTLLQCPKDGGSYFLDAILETIATKVGADLVVLDAQDISQALGPYLDEDHAWAPSGTASLGYTSQKAAGKLEEIEPEEPEEEEEEEDFEPFTPRQGQPRFGKVMPFARIIHANLEDLRTVAMSKTPSDRLRHDFKLLTPEGGIGMPKPGSIQWGDLKASAALEKIIDSAEAKRADQRSDALLPHGKMIVQVKDYTEIFADPVGRDLLVKLRAAIDRRWAEGRDIILVGTTSNLLEAPVDSRSKIQNAQSYMMENERKTIVVPPARSDEFQADEKARIRSMNIRHIEDMIRQLAQGSERGPLNIDIEKDLNSNTAFLAGLEEAVLMYATVHRIATTILGLEVGNNDIDGTVFGHALEILSSSDEVKFEWSTQEKEQSGKEERRVKDVEDEVETPQRPEKMTAARLKQIKKNATSHEAKLLGGVIMPEDIKTTFSKVHAAKDTVDALKTLTSLSLIRPEAFSYGVLALDRIPGLLLYGPPGTGKTLLAKAVAKESGATVLEVSGAEVNDMYVGEGEKNVKALFSLAKKLSPCVVFIDEADAMFAARGGEGQRSTRGHRELINQFLREWDGMNDMSAFIMVATNRPFDLDEAVLRRLPRRLLVDLPAEKDRESILGIHLKDEVLDDTVSLKQLAKDTPYYSGSDLKNLSVAAAMACIREENETALQHTGDTPYTYPKRRTLSQRHFARAMEEISASISDDMSTLSAIRKFDERYGDRKGRRKKKPAMGFGGTVDAEKDSEAARVRKIEVR